MECLIHSPAFDCAKMAWVAGVGGTVPMAARLSASWTSRRAWAHAPLWHGPQAPEAVITPVKTIKWSIFTCAIVSLRGITVYSTG